MDIQNVLIMNMKVNIDGTPQTFLRTFNQRSFMTDDKKTSRPYLHEIERRRLSGYNKKYALVTENTPSSIETFVQKILDSEYKVGQYLYVPTVMKGYTISSRVISNITSKTIDKILYGSNDTLRKKLEKELGKAFLENIQFKDKREKKTTKFFIVDTTFFVKHKNRALRDKFDEFCIRNKANFDKSVRHYKKYTMKGSSRNTRRRASRNKTRRRK